MTQEDLQSYVFQKFKTLEIEPLAFDLTLVTSANDASKLLTLLKQDSELAFDNVMCVSGVDNMDSIDVVYHLHSYAKNHRIGVKIKLNRENPETPTATHLWPGANWHERETFDLYGVKFINHPDLRRILLADDWEGYPMRKDYTHWNLVPLPDDVTEVTKDYSRNPEPLR